jgi:dihydroceramidase
MKLTPLSCMNPNPVYHQAVFATLVFATGFRVTYLIRWSPTYKSRTPDDVKRACLAMFWAGGGLFALGFAIWNLDNVFCDTLTRWKRAIGWPIAFLLEGPSTVVQAEIVADARRVGHSWWHIFTAWGTYLMMQGVGCKLSRAVCARTMFLKRCLDLVLCVKDDHRKFTLDWNHGLPNVARVRPAQVSTKVKAL